MLGLRSKKSGQRRRLLRENRAEQGTPKFSYHTTSRPTESTKIQQRTRVKTSEKRKLNFAYLPSLLSASVVLACVVYAMTLSPTPKIAAVGDGSGTALLFRNTDDYVLAAQDIMSESPLNRTKLTVDTKYIEDKVLSRFPELEDVSAIIPLTGRRLAIELSPSRPAILLNNDNGSYVLNSSGRAILQPGQIGEEKTSELLIAEDESGVEISLGSQVMTSQQTSYILTVASHIKESGTEIERVVLPAIPNELRVYLADKQYFIKFNMEADPHQSAGAYIAVKDKIKNEAKQYVDVRVEGRVFYR